MTEVIELTEVKKQSQPLRTIGQALEEMRLDSFEIVAEGSDFVIRSDSAAVKKPAAGGWGALWRKLTNSCAAHDSSSTAPAAPEMRFGWEALLRMDVERKAGTSGQHAKPDVYNLSEMLRLVGAYLDMKRAQLLRLSKKEQHLTIEYRTEPGEVRTEEHDVASFYDLSVHLYLKRAKRVSSTSSPA